MAGRFQGFLDLGQTRGGFDRDDLRPRRHDLAGDGLPEVHDRFDHVAHFLVDDAFLLAFLDDGENLLLDVILGLAGGRLGWHARRPADHSVEDVHQLHDRPHEPVERVKHTHAVADDGVAHVPRDRGRQHDGAEQRHQRAENDGERVVSRRPEAERLDQFQRQKENRDVEQQPPDGGDKRQVLLVLHRRIEPAGEAFALEMVAKADARQVADRIGEG